MQAKYFIRKVINKFSLLPKKKQCNICEKKVFDFLPLPDHYQKNFLKYGFPHTQKGAFESIDVDHFFCPDCYCMDRERLYAWYLKNNIRLHDDYTLLDFAPSVSLSKWIQKNFAIKYVTADLFMDNVDVKTDIEDMQVFAAESFDFVICSHVMEHVNDDVKAMGEIFRVLKIGGEAIIMAPILRNFDGVDEDPTCHNVAERWNRFGQDDHIRLYSQKVFSQRLQHVGFKLKFVTEKEIAVSDIIQFGIPQNVVLYIAQKT